MAAASEVVTQAQLEWAQEQLAAAVTSGDEVLAASEGKVADNTVRVELQGTLEAASKVRDGDPVAADDYLAQQQAVDAAKQAVTDAQESWQAEQERQQAAAAAAASASKGQGSPGKGSASTGSSSSTGSSGSTSGGSSSGNSTGSPSGSGSSSSGNSSGSEGGTSGGSGSSSGGKTILDCYYFDSDGVMKIKPLFGTPSEVKAQCDAIQGK